MWKFGMFLMLGWGKWDEISPGTGKLLAGPALKGAQIFFSETVDAVFPGSQAQVLYRLEEKEGKA